MARLGGVSTLALLDIVVINRRKYVLTAFLYPQDQKPRIEKRYALKRRIAAVNHLQQPRIWTHEVVSNDNFNGGKLITPNLRDRNNTISFTFGNYAVFLTLGF
ncbi:hypothetical protein PNOK_0917600 [Pyrrhoderma noxium]|uniref:Uncharacterized protein n=1 Tax=Pyrrhoderma noxium TaxID=2282107 RepID=A0A286U778_9AGAM|nr:hypothetical protein PNOK_0917600 [Pyrrhoderma noxium]